MVPIDYKCDGQMLLQAYAVKYINVDDLIPYEKNAKKHPDEQISQIAESIRQFGFRQNLVIDKNNVVVIGHGRLLAARKLGMKSVPCVCVDDLSDEQIKALRLADNRVAESEWDEDLLKLDLDDISEIDMSDFGFETFDDEQEPEPEVEDDDNGLRDSLQHNVFENQERAQFDADNFFGIPAINPTQTYGDKWLRFCDHGDVSDPSDYICHFYYDDFKFMAAWREPDKYLDKLRKFKAVVAPDFSLYTDFPRALQILSCYRRQWCGAYWQSLGIDVIPDVVWGDKKSYDYCFLGIPKHSVVAVSSVGVSNDKDWNGSEGERFRDGYNEMMRRLEPTKVLFYGTILDGLPGEIIRIPSFYEQKRKMLNERSKVKHGNKI